MLICASTAYRANAQNPIVLENENPGTDPSVWYVEGPGDSNIQGFGTDMSVNRGETVHFKIDTDASAYHIDIYRLGYYHGDGARNVGTGVITAPLPQTQPACLYEETTGLTDCGNWAESAHWDVPAGAVSGIYVAKLTRDDATEGTSHIVFIVRDDASTSDLLFQTSDATWQAYNLYGGKSVYPAGGGPPGFNHATKASYNRPFDIRHADGAPGDDVFAAEYPMVRWLEANGYDVSYTSSVDTDRRGGLIQLHKVFLSVGHDEYWSGPQRANVTAARDAGVNLAFFSGNEVYWKTRYEPSIDGSGTPYRTMVVYKEGSLGENVCGTKCDPNLAWTGLWRDGCAPPYDPVTNGACLPENALTGQISWDGTIGAIQVPDTYKDLRFWRNTSIAALAPGQTATLGAQSLGSEWDWEHPQYQSSYPPRRIKLSTTILNGLTHHLSLYRADSGALVFGAGTIQWSWGLDSFHTFSQVGTNADMQQATVNLFADMGATPGSLQPGLIEATASSDTQSPASVITAPADGTTTALNNTVNIQGTAADAGGGVVAGVEVSVDGGATWHAATGASTWSYAWSPTAEGSVTIKSRAFDDTGNLENPTGSANVITATVTAPECPCSVFPPSEAPATPSVNDGSGANELGMRFRADVDGFITALRYYKPAGATGTHTGNLWTNTGTNLARQEFTNESASGWQEVALPTPVPITAGTTYVVSYFSASGDYLGVNYYFTHQVGNGLVHGLADGADGANGLYQYNATTTFPTQSYRSSNYYADVVFTTSTGPDVTPPTVSSHVPATGATGVTASSAVTVTFSEALDPGTVSSATFELRDPLDASVPASVTYDSGTHTATLVPSAALDTLTTYTAIVHGGTADPRIKDESGNPLAADVSWSFTTAGPAPQSFMVFPPSQVPTSPLVNDNAGAMELGMRFRADVDGVITALRYYKPAGATGTHTGNLWTGTGTNLARQVFTNETASGWQEVTLPTPVPITAGTTYVVSYFTASGDYLGVNYYFTQQAGNGLVHGLADGTDGPNGLYQYTATTAFPTQSFRSSNYYADVLFIPDVPDITPPTVTAHVPATAATGVPSNSTVTVTFSEALDASTVSGVTFELRDALNASVPASVTYDSGTQTATLTPSTTLGLLATYTAIVHGGTTDPRIRDPSGNALAADVSWSFTIAATAACPCRVFPPSEAPTNPVSNDHDPAGGIELGMRFRADADGVITALRYYKPAGATGLHTGNLWTSAGTNLAQQAFTGETASGWQEVALPTPVPITAGTTYVVSYFSASGDYVSTLDYFTQQVGTGPVHGLADGTDGPNGLYQYTAATTLPTQSFRSSNYYVDVVFNFNASLLTQSISFAALADRRVDSGDFAVSATASSGLAVSFSTSTPLVCTVSDTTVSLHSTGPCTLHADQAGDASYAPAPQVTQSFSVTAALLAQSIDFPAIADQTLNTSSFAPSVSATSGLPVTLTSQTPAKCTVSGATVMLVATGTCTLEASQAGNGTYAAATPVMRSFGILEDTTPPVISNVSIVTRSDGSATVSWQTNEPADGRLLILAPVSEQFYDAFILPGHTFNLTGLTLGETYSYRITAADPALNESSLPAEDQPPATFTMPQPDVPVVSFPLALASPVAAADYRHDIGFSRLQQELGASIPDGAGVIVSQVEPTTQVGGQPTWMPDVFDAEFAGKTITDESNSSAGLYSGFATAVGRDFYGISTSIAPAIGNIAVFSAGHWLGGGLLQTTAGIGGAAPQVSTSRITNHSWVGTASNFDSFVLARLDWLVGTDESIQVVAVDNGDGNTANNLGLLTSAYNVIAVGRSDGQQLLGSAAVDGTYTAGRARPDIVDPADSTISTTPHVSAAAALLVQAGHANSGLSTDPVSVSVTNRAGDVVWNAERSEVIKAALMAGADRVTHNATSIDLANYRGTVADRTDNGLDRRYGAGQLNVRNSYWIIAGGEQNSTEDGNAAATVASRGFDYDPHFGGLNGSNTTATYPLPVQAQPSLLTASLVWNLAIAGGAADNFDPAATLEDLNVAVIDLGNGDAVVASSASALENTENISFVVPANAQYALRVTRTGSFDWDYGVAWQLLPDADADGAYDSRDNCISVYNRDQFDADDDGYGNICDADLNNSGEVTVADYTILRNLLNTDDPVADLNHSGHVTVADYTILRNRLNTAPGPSGLCAATPAMPCTPP